jgi:hypothetical protein
MNMLEAMRDTIALMEEGLLKKGPYFNDRIAAMEPNLRPDHLRDMLRIMESGVNPQDTEAGFSDGKMGRWLGWAQAAVVALHCGTLDDMKDINRRHAEKNSG